MPGAGGGQARGAVGDPAAGRPGLTSPDPVHVLLTPDPIDVSRLAGGYASRDGAVVSFVGTVRGETEGQPVRNLLYEAFDEMASAEMRRIAEEACRRWGASSVRIVHRTGLLEVGDVAVAIVVAAPHRGEAFDACEFVIDTLKRTVPIWKKEQFEGGASRWVNHP